MTSPSTEGKQISEYINGGEQSEQPPSSTTMSRSRDNDALVGEQSNEGSPSGTLERARQDNDEEKAIKPDEINTNDSVDNAPQTFQQCENDDDGQGKTHSTKRTMYKVQKKNSRYYFQHPFLRLLIAYIIVFFNFLIFAEDPVSHSNNDAELPVIGNDIGFLIYRYPPGGWAFLKILLLVSAVAVGMVIGKFLIHKRFLARFLRLSMFSNNQGSWMIMFLTSIISLFIFSHIFNGFLSAGSNLEKYKLSNRFGLSNGSFMKFAALGTWTGDFVTAWMVTDMMLQDRLYPSWATCLRGIWRRKWYRIIAFWAVWITATIIVATAITTDYIKWDDLNRDFVSTNEVSRAFLASVILVMDLLIVMQDWDFPRFQSNIDVKLPGLDTSSFHITPPRCLKKENWAVHITGKWFNYGIIFIVMILDMNMWKNQIFYDPFTYGQYTDSNGYIYTVSNMSFLESANKTTLSYDWRWNNTNPLTNQSYGVEDMKMNSKYLGFALGVKGIAFIPSLAAFLLFGVFVWIYGREEAVTVCSDKDQIDGIIIDKWEADDDSEERHDHGQEDAKTRPKSVPIQVEEADSKTEPSLVKYEKNTSS